MGKAVDGTAIAPHRTNAVKNLQTTETNSICIVLLKSIRLNGENSGKQWNGFALNLSTFSSFVFSRILFYERNEVHMEFIL